MFGWDVNKTKVESGSATQQEKNVCTAASKDECQAGVAGSAPGQFDSPGSAVKGIAFSTGGELYAATDSDCEILAYVAKFVAV